MKVIHFTRLFYFLLLTLTLTACGGGGGGGDAPASSGSNAVSSSSDIQSISGINTLTSGTNGGGSAQPATANFSVSWVAPALREDSSALSLANIAGYRVYSGTAPNTYSDITFVNDSTATSFDFTNVPIGTYYIAVTTLDTDGLEGRLSEEVQLVVTN